MATKISNDYDRSIFWNRIEKQFRKGNQLVVVLKLLNSNLFDCSDRESWLLFKKSISNLDIEKGQKFGLRNLNKKSLCYQEIASVKSLIKHNSDQMGSTLIHEITLPFYNPNYQETMNCLPKSKLPKFYTRLPPPPPPGEM